MSKEYEGMNITIMPNLGHENNKYRPLVIVVPDPSARSLFRSLNQKQFSQGEISNEDD